MEYTHLQKIRLYVVTVNYKSLEYLKNLVKSIQEVDELEKVIVVDHSGELNYQSFDTPIPVQLIKQSNRGYGAGLNRGLKEIQASDALVLVCNPDVRVLTPELFKNVARYMKSNPKIGALSPRILSKDGDTVSSCRKFYNLLTVLTVRFKWLKRLCPQFIEEHYYRDKGHENQFVGDWASGAALFCRLSAFPDRMFFDERFFLYFEDVDFGATIWKRGYTVEYFPAFKVEHAGACRSRRNPLFFFMHLGSLVKFVWKHKGFPSRDSLVKSRESWNKKADALETVRRCATKPTNRL